MSNQAEEQAGEDGSAPSKRATEGGIRRLRRSDADNALAEPVPIVGSVRGHGAVRREPADPGATGKALERPNSDNGSPRVGGARAMWMRC